MNPPVNPGLLTMALRLMQVALDRALRLDPQAAMILQPLAGKRIAVRIVGAAPTDLCVEFSNGRILLAQAAEQSGNERSAPQGCGSKGLPGDADVSIRGSASALAMLARGVDDLPSSAQVSVHGDLALLQQARVAVARLRPDFDEPLARLLGDEMAYPLSRAVRRLGAIARRSFRELDEDLKEYLGEESELLASREDVRNFGDEVDRLRDAVERLDKRALRVASRLDVAGK